MTCHNIPRLQIFKCCRLVAGADFKSDSFFFKLHTNRNEKYKMTNKRTQTARIFWCNALTNAASGHSCAAWTLAWLRSLLLPWQQRWVKWLKRHWERETLQWWSEKHRRLGFSQVDFHICWASSRDCHEPKIKSNEKLKKRTQSRPQSLSCSYTKLIWNEQWSKKHRVSSLFSCDPKQL